MSLRVRLAATVALVLVLGSLLGLGLAGLSARRWLRDELQSAQRGAAMAVRRAYESAGPGGESVRDLGMLAATFDGDRHLRAAVVGADGRVLGASSPAQAVAAPGWFAGLVKETLPPQRLAAPGPAGAAVELQPVYDDDISAVWAEFLDLGLVVAAACAGGAALVWLVVGRSLKPLRMAAEVLPRIGRGDYAAEAPEAGPPEVAEIGRGVNAMARRLAEMRRRNQALEGQILTLQEEERADIARDLHDEIGPHLFAANIDLATALAGAGDEDAVVQRVRAAQGSITHVQTLVRDILARLRPAPAVELGFSAAVQDLAAFWRARRPNVVFALDLPEADEAVPAPLRETAYRLVQESLSNAMRHSSPTRIAVSVTPLGSEVRVEVCNDGAPATRGAPGFGLAGMAERVGAVGGALEVGPTDGGFWRVQATLPPI